VKRDTCPTTSSVIIDMDDATLCLDEVIAWQLELDVYITETVDCAP